MKQEVVTEKMCHQNCDVEHLSVEEAIAADESLLIYCKPVELYNILRRRAQDNPSFLRRCLRYKIKERRKKRLRDGIVIFNYKDYKNMLRKTEATEDFSCPFCLMQCLSFKGLRYHLCSSHDLFNFDFWVTEEYQAVTVSVNIDRFISETVADGIEQRQQTFFFCSKPRTRKSKNLDQNAKKVSIKFLELNSSKLATEGMDNGFLGKEEGENASKSSSSEKDLHNMRDGAENYGSECPTATELMERVASSFSIPGVSIAQAQSSVDPECVKSQSGSEPSLPPALHPAKARKLTVERPDPKYRALLQKRQFYHSHRVQPMALEQVMSDRDSEDEDDDDIADFEDRRMLDDFVDVSKDEKQLMHLWNSFVRKQRVLADGHIPWACEAFSKLHGQELVISPALFWCWRLFMIKLWNHGLLDASTMNNCNMILERCRDEGSAAAKIPDSSPPLPSEPPDIRNWFPSYQYESFVLDTYDVFGGSIHKETDFECLKDGCLCIEEGSKGKEIISCDATRIDINSSDDNQHEDQSFNKMPDSLCSLSLLSEPPDVRNWFPSYEYESPVLDTAEYFNESAIKESEGEKDGFATEESKKRREEKAGDLSNSGNNEIRANEKPSSYGFIKCKSSYGDVCDNKPLSKVPDSSQSSSFLSEPPDIRNWFPSYVYESPVPGESIGFLHGITERDGDDLANQDSRRDEETDLWKLGQNRSSEETEHSNGFLKLNSSLGNHKQEKSLNKVSPSQDTRDVEKEGSSILDNLHREGKLGMEDESFLNHAIAPTEDVEKPSLRLEVPPFKQSHMQNLVQEVGFMSVTSTVRASDKSATKLNYRKDSAENLDKARTEIDLVSPRGNVKFARGAGVFSMSQSTHGRSNNKENEGKEAQGNGFVTTRKSRITKPNVENSLDRDRQQQILSECSKGRMTSRDGERDEKDAAVKRKVLSEVSNLEHPDGIGVTGKWKCPQKSKPNLGPPMKQLRLERWVHRL